MPEEDWSKTYIEMMECPYCGGMGRIYKHDIDLAYKPPLQERILELLKEEGPLKSGEINRRLGLDGSRGVHMRNILKERGLIKEVEDRGTGGRPAIMVYLAPDLTQSLPSSIWTERGSDCSGDPSE